MTNLSAAVFKATGATASRTLANHVGASVNVLNFTGVVGDNSTDCTTGIQAAIDYAAGLGWSASGQTGGEVFIPAGDYVVIAPLKNNTASTSIRIRGAGRNTTRIHGSFAGWVIDQDDSTAGNITVIEGLNVTNYRNNADSGGIRFNNSQEGVIRDCLIGGFNGVQATSNAYNGRIEGCDVNPSVTARTAGTIGIAAGEFGIYNCSLLGWDDAITTTNAGCVISNSRTESSNRGIVLGGAGFAVLAHTTERCGTAMDLVNTSGGVIIGGAITGTVAGASLAITSITRSGTTATVTTTANHGLTGNQLLTIQGATQTDYNGQYSCNCNVAVNQFSYTVANSPTTPATGTITYLNTPSYGIRVRNVSAVELNSVSISCQANVAGIDMGSMTGNTFSVNNVLVNIGSGIGSNYVMPETNNTPTFYASSVQFRNSNNPTAAFPFNNLPTSPIQGMEFNITDGQKTGSVALTGSDLGATVIAGGSQKVKVRYNGTNWTCAGF